MSYQFKYLTHFQDQKEGEQKIVQVMDKELAEIRDKKGEYHAQTVEFMTNVRLFATIAPREAAHQLAVFVARYMMAVFVDKTGSVKAAQKLKEELIEDATKVGDNLLSLLEDAE